MLLKFVKLLLQESPAAHCWLGQNSGRRIRIDTGNSLLSVSDTSPSLPATLERYRVYTAVSYRLCTQQKQQSAHSSALSAAVSATNSYTEQLSSLYPVQRIGKTFGKQNRFTLPHKVIRLVVSW